MPDRLISNVLGNIGRKTSALLALSFVALPAALNAQSNPSNSIRVNGSPTHVYSMHLFHDEMSFAQPVNQWVYYFRMAPGVVLNGPSYLDLEYECSATIRPGEGTMSILLNGKPVASRKIGDSKTRHTSWRVDLPNNLFKEGFNDLRMISRQIAIDGPCKDVDFSANWVRLSKSSIMHLERAEPPNFPIAAFPFPYLDTLEDNLVQSYWVVPPNPQPSVIAEALGMASDWGRYEPARALPITLIQGQPKSAQNILIGGSGSWSSSQTQNLGADQGSIAVEPGGAPGQARLHVSGGSDVGIKVARQALGHSEMVAQMRGSVVPITAPPAEAKPRPTTRVGTFTFSDLGMTSIRLAGSYQQRTTITIQRPVRCDLGRDSYINLHFRHSANLNPLRSSLNVSINGVPFSSIRLTPDNANGDTVKARIPVNELTKNLWTIDLLAYHDLASIDCSKSYDDVAFTVIEGDSSFDFGTGALGGRPFLDAFPYLVGRDGLAQKLCSISLPSSPSNSAMSAAATIAARAAQMNRQSFDWDVSLGNLPQSKSSSIAIGYYGDIDRFAPIANQMLVHPKAGGGWTIDPQLRLLSSALNGGAILQAVRSPWTDTGVLYVLLAANDAALDNFVKFMADGNKAAQLTGEVAVLQSDGKLVTLDTIDPDKSRNSQAQELDRYTPAMMIATIIVLLVFVALAVQIAKQFVRRPPENPV